MIATLLLVTAMQLPMAERFGLVLVRGDDTVAVERISRTSGDLRDEVLVPGRARLVIVVDVDSDGCAVGAESSVYPWGSGEGSSPVQRVEVRIDGDSIRVHAAARGMTQAFARPRAGARFVLAGEAVGAAALLLDCARSIDRDGADVGAWVFPNLRQVTAKVRPYGDSTLVVTSDSSWVHHSPDGGVARMVVGRSGLEARRVSEAELARVHFAAPDYSAPADAPYRAESLTVRVDDRVTLAGTLTLPTGRPGPFPAVVTISGSGAQDRDSHADVADGWRPFREIADSLGRRGVAVLRFDDRGAGGSTGDHAAGTERTAAADVAAVVAFLRRHPDIAPERIALLGHSEGVRIAMLAGADDSALAALALLSGAADTRAAIRAQAVWAAEHGPARGRLPRDSVIARIDRTMDSLAGLLDREVFRWNAAVLADRIAVPVGIFHGGTDRQVPPSQADSLAAVFRRAGNRDVSTTVFPNRNHLLVPDPDGDFLRYRELRSARLGRDVLGAVVDWLVARLGRPI